MKPVKQEFKNLFNQKFKDMGDVFLSNLEAGILEIKKIKR